MAPSSFDPPPYLQDNWSSKKSHNGSREPFSKFNNKSTSSFTSISVKLDTIPEDNLDLVSLHSDTNLESSLNACSTLEKNKNDPQTFNSHTRNISSYIPSISPSPPPMHFNAKSKTSIELTVCSTPTSIYTCLLDPRPYHVTKVFQSNSSLLDAIMNALEPGPQRDMFTKVLYACRKTMPDLPWVHRLASFLYDVPPLLDTLLRMIGWVGGRISPKSLDFSFHSFTASNSEAMEEFMVDSSSISSNLSTSITPTTTRFAFLGVSSFANLHQPVPSALSKRISNTPSSTACSLVNSDAVVPSNSPLPPPFPTPSPVSSSTSNSSSRLLTKLNPSTSTFTVPTSNSFLPQFDGSLLKKKTASTIDLVSPLKKQMYSKLISHYSTTSTPPNVSSLPTSPFDTLSSTGITSSIAMAEEGSTNTLISNMVIPLK